MFGNLFFDQKQLSKTLILHHPLKIVQKQSQKNNLFFRLKKGGQVIDLEVAKLLTLKWPKCGQVIDPTAHIYIYIYVDVGVDILLLVFPKTRGPSNSSRKPLCKIHQEIHLEESATRFLPQEQAHPNLYPLAGDDRPLDLLKPGSLIREPPGSCDS